MERKDAKFSTLIRIQIKVTLRIFSIEKFSRDYKRIVQVSMSIQIDFRLQSSIDKILQMI